MVAPVMTKDYFTNPEGKKLFRILYNSSIQPSKALVFVCHGLFEHCQTAYYEPIIRPLNEIGCVVITHDHIGHGLSEGGRGMIYDFDSIVRDVLLDIDSVMRTKKKKETPIFIYGHSVGGLIAIYATLRRSGFFKGMCLEAPALVYPSKIGKRWIFFAKVINTVWPQYTFRKMDFSHLCRNTNHIEALDKDELVIHTGISAKTATELYNAIYHVKDSLRDVKTPLIIGHGEADEIFEVTSSTFFLEVCQSKDKKLITFPGAKHQLRMEIEGVSEQFTKMIIEWVKARIN